MKRIVWFISLLVVVTLACNMYSIVPTYVAPTTIPYVPQVAVAPPAIDFLSNTRRILESNGFYQDNFQCSSTVCDSYTYNGASDTYISAFAYHDNTFSMAVSIADGVDVKTEGRVLASVIFEMYGEEVSNWIANHMEASLDADQSGYVGGHSLVEIVHQGDGNPAVIIEIDF